MGRGILKKNVGCFSPWETASGTENKAYTEP
jgi:hypothetical protein